MFVCLCGGKPLNWVPMGATLLAKSQCGLLDVLVKEGFCGIILDVKEDFFVLKVIIKLNGVGLFGKKYLSLSDMKKKT